MVITSFWLLYNNTRRNCFQSGKGLFDLSEKVAVESEPPPHRQDVLRLWIEHAQNEMTWI
jgi:hypothetical protein